jgi:hypothetical protein
MSWISQSRDLTLVVTIGKVVLEGNVAVLFEDSDEMDAPEMCYDLDMMKFAPKLKQKDRDVLSEQINDYFYGKFSRGLNGIIEHSTINLKRVGNKLVED